MDDLKKAIQAIRDADIAGDCLLAYRLVDQGVEQYPESVEMWALAVTLRLWRGDRAGAHAAMRKSKELNQNLAIVWAVESDLLAFEGDLENAKAAADNAIALDDKDRWVLERCVSTYAMLRENAKAMELRDRWEELYPDDSGGILSKVTGLLSEDRVDESEALLKEAEHRFPDSPFVMQKRGRFLMKQHRLDEAIIMLQKAVDSQPNNWSIISELSSALSFANRLDEAEAAAMRALEISQISTLALKTLARICRERGETRQAAEWNEKAANAIPVLHFLSYITSANAASRKGEWNQAIGFTDKALTCNLPPITHGLALEIKARAMLELKRYNQIDAIFAELDAMQRVSCAMFELRGRLFVVTGKHDEAINMFREGIQKYPSDGTLRAHLLRSLYTLGRFEEQSDLVNDVFQNLPQTPWEYSALYMAFEDTKHYEESHRLLKVARELYPDKEDFRVFEAVKNVEKGNFAAARELVKDVKGPFRKVARMIFYFEMIANQIFNRILRMMGKKPVNKPPTLN